MILLISLYFYDIINNNKNSTTDILMHYQPNLITICDYKFRETLR